MTVESPLVNALPNPNVWQSLFETSGQPDEIRHFRVINRNGKPWLILPIKNAKAASATMALFPAQRRAAKLSKAVLQRALQFNLPIPAKKTQISLCADDPFIRFLARAGGATGQVIPEFAILAGNPRAPGQRFMVLVFDNNHRPIAVIKAGLSPEAQKLIAAETLFLQSIQAPRLGIPELLGELKTEKVHALALHFVEAHTPTNDGQESEIATLLTGWLDQERTVSMSDLAVWQDLQPFIAELPALASLHTHSFHPAMFHGDLAPWNIKVGANGRWTVLDWERGDLVGPPGWDWFHFVIQPMILVHKFTTEQIINKIRHLLKDGRFKAYAHSADIVGIEQELLIGYLTYSALVLRPMEGMNELLHLRNALLKSFVGKSRRKSYTQGGGDRTETTDDTPEISIITPSFNQLDWLQLCVSSVLDQRGVCVEHIVQDAGSQEISAFPGRLEQLGIHQSREDFVPGDILYSKQASNSLLILLETDSGMYDAINRGFAKARGEIVAWLNCDEQYLPGTLHTVVEYFHNHPEVDVLFGDALLLEADGNLLSYRLMMKPSAIHTRTAHLATLSCSMFFRRSLIERGFTLDTNWKTIADALLVVRMLEKNCRIAVLNEPLAVFTMTGANLGQSSLLLTEMDRWRQELPVWQRRLTPLLVLRHRLRKLMAGAYGRKKVHSSVYTKASPAKRVVIDEERTSFAWPRLSEDNLSHETNKWWSPGSPSTSGSHNSVFQQGMDKSTLRRRRLLVGTAGLVFMVLATLLDFKLKLLAVTPLLAAITLLILAAVLQPLEIALMAAVFSVAVYFSLHNVLHNTTPGDALNWIRVFLRLGMFGVASTLAVLFSRYRLRSQKLTQQTLDVLRWIPGPVLVSDAHGCILFANHAAEEFVGCNANDLKGCSYATLLLATEGDGASSRIYRRVFEEARTTGGTVQLCLKSGQKLDARTVSIGERHERLLVTLAV